LLIKPIGDLDEAIAKDITSLKENVVIDKSSLLRVLKMINNE